jgi:hypothetical protein
MGEPYNKQDEWFKQIVGRKSSISF